jgi:CRP-like cAMP-binding protein
MALRASHAFGAFVLDGMLLQRLQLGDHEAMRLIGPGDLIAAGMKPSSTLVGGFRRRAISDLRLAVLGHDFLLAARRWPALIAGLHLRMAEQVDRAAAQITICQLARVADRVLAMMWLLAETWGRVTASGVTLPVSLTHEALGALVGARRPTVSLALAELIERGAVVRQRTGWLLLERLPEPALEAGHTEPPVLLEPEDSSWTTTPAPSPPSPPSPPPRVGEELLETVERLRAEVGRAREETNTRLATVRSNRERIHARRARLAEEAVSRPRAPSSG